MDQDAGDAGGFCMIEIRWFSAVRGSIPYSKNSGRPVRKTFENNPQKTAILYDSFPESPVVAGAEKHDAWRKI